MEDCDQWKRFVLSLETAHSTSAHGLVSIEQVCGCNELQDHLEPRSTQESEETGLITIYLVLDPYTNFSGQ